MRLPCAPSRALRAVRTPLAFARNGQWHSLHTGTYNAAVIGGGITGLTTAFRLTQDPACSKIALFEEAPEVGGWMSSSVVKDPAGNQVVFEDGPRTLRAVAPACLPLLDLLVELDLLDDVLITSKTSPAATNRFIYYPDHLVRLPTPDPRSGFFGHAFELIRTVFTEPLFENAVWNILSEPLKPRPERRPQDESLAEFWSRRLSPEVADNLVSPVFHGIFAGDIDRLSAQYLMGAAREMENHERRVIGGYLDTMSSGVKYMVMDDLLALHSLSKTKQKAYWRSLQTLIRGASVLTFKNGTQQLAHRLAEVLRQSNKVRLLTGTEVTAISQNPDTSDLTVHYGENKSESYNRIIATNPAPDLAEKLAKPIRPGQQLPQNSIRHLKEHNYAVTVAVVNLFFETPDLLPVQGFGYLIPRSIPYEQNPERALGVIFGSETSIGQDTRDGTKVTVMMGGHWWDGWKESDYPSTEASIAMARDVLARHLNITEEPILVGANLKKNAIPQYTVGHLSRMEELSEAVRHDFKNRLTLAGNWYNGIGVTDCIRQGYMAASYGVGAMKLDAPNRNVPWVRHNWENWDLEGGIPMSPVRWTDTFASERSQFY
ncbi:oxygen-dependent protoporphyrinogen oxidase [Aspergillus clavatus NRRL 1]|uniref:Protoporphyrinogen oxidase n=1 Tax=Aspergillus clavatus (strain ATCC 1007 / CBS 513.65 / DSM 816 / NCTC 3887 / NRRL 1 / QM 1276 / 107) TaxID=344612 RepID=A1CT95_ASPCL|nr:protoporphyrinogen oxidase, putative [Aspergillus clavatus NRRL 1]EAW06532.1 protoporphyrinogen oxidase, putative [Aspergillus clavatus NRRL 1]